MDEPLVRIGFFLVACLAVGMVTAACRATSLPAIVRKMVEQFLSMALGIAAICVGIWLLSLVVQA